MHENPLGIVLSVMSLACGFLLLATGWPLRWIGGIGILSGLAGLARIAGVV